MKYWWERRGRFGPPAMMDCRSNDPWVLLGQLNQHQGLLCWLSLWTHSANQQSRFEYVLYLQSSLSLLKTNAKVCECNLSAGSSHLSCPGCSAIEACYRLYSRFFHNITALWSIIPCLLYSLDILAAENYDLDSGLGNKGNKQTLPKHTDIWK